MIIRAVVFDFDGTLTPLTLDFVEIRREIERIAGRYASPVVVSRLDNLYILEMIRHVEAMIGEAGPRFRREAFVRLSEIEIEAAVGKQLYPYTREVLSTLRRQSVRIGIITRNCARAVEKTFPDMGVYVDVMKTRDDVREVKPDPGHVRAVLEALRVDAGESLLVGDHPTDMEAGRQSGVRTVGVLAGKATTADLEEAGADFVVDDVRGVVGIVSGGSAPTRI